VPAALAVILGLLAYAYRDPFDFVLGGIALVMTVVWGALTALVRFQFGYGRVGVIAVLVASVTAVVSPTCRTPRA